MRAGAFGTLRGGHPGDPGVGLTIAVQTAAELQRVLGELGAVKATVLVPADFADMELLEQASAAGHEVAGRGTPRNFAALEVAARQPLKHWAPDLARADRADLRALAQAGLRPLPEPAAAALPGAILEVSPEQLAEKLAELERLGYQPRPVRELLELRPATPRDLLEHIYQRVVEDQYAQREGLIDLSQRFDAMMRVAPLDHAPEPLPLPRGTPTAELHLNSGRLVGLASKQWLGTYRAYQRSLKDVAQALETHPELHSAQAVFAVTLFHRPLEKSGFTLLDLPPLRARWYGLGFRVLRLAYGTQRRASDETPKMAWMPREEFLKKFG